ncbi:AI-2E family transporter [Methanosarcina sp. KYL-1]|uniref:AI-2E family transporter n=1 Tax=Methanosarcina sp. KYL-1 TaxID=2602068 RepID=UPI0021019746|nr:AI-2E family transporter [Methanosarcina sp. KYL-1]MCQ1534868.1 AI-2E family transporter [Methanosarcina sp. KYL-1]
MKNYDPVKVGYAVIIILVSLYALYITSAFFYVLILSGLFAYIIHPAYAFSLKFVKNRQISALIPLVTIFLFATFFTISTAGILLNEVSKLLEIPNTINGFVSMDLRQIIGIFEPFISTSPGELTRNIGSSLNTLVTDHAPEIQGIVLQVSSDLTIFTVELVVVVILTYYLLVESSNIAAELPNLFPDKKVGTIFLTELNHIYHNLFNVYFLTCLLTGVFGGILYWLLGVPYPIIWGILTFVLALLPVVGAGTVFGLLALYYALLQEFFTAAALLVFGTLFLSIVPDFIIRPRLAKKSKAAIHPAITLVAFAAPLFVLGPVGIIIGPLTYGFLLAAYRARKIVLEGERADGEMVEDEMVEDEKSGDERFGDERVGGKSFSEMISETVSAEDSRGDSMGESIDSGFAN